MNIQALEWLTGQWIGKCGNDPVDEYWSLPAGGVLMGMFRWLKADAVYLYEFMTIEPEGDSAVLRIKHFALGGIGREEKDDATEFVLERLDAYEARFLMRDRNPGARRLIYRRPDPTRLLVLLELDDTGERIIEFTYERRE